MSAGSSTGTAEARNGADAKGGGGQGIPPLGDYCDQHGFTDFSQYCESADVEETITELTRDLLRDRPADPKEYLLEKYRGMYPLERFAQQNKTEEIGVEQFIRLFEATRNITHEIVPSESINICIRESVKLLMCDRVSIFIYDTKIKMLILSASNLSKPIRVNPGQGIAGHVFKTGETVFSVFRIPQSFAVVRLNHRLS